MMSNLIRKERKQDRYAQPKINIMKRMQWSHLLVNFPLVLRMCNNKEIEFLFSSELFEIHQFLYRCSLVSTQSIFYVRFCL